MTTAFKGPLIVYGQRPPRGTAGSENPRLGPSIFWGGIGFIDSRWGYNRTVPGAFGWYGSNLLLDVVPSTLSAVNIAAAQVPVAATALTLVSATGSGVTVLAAAQGVATAGNIAIIPSGALALDGVGGFVGFGSADPTNSSWQDIKFYDPTKSVARNVRITSAGNDSGATFTVAGYDIYGVAMSETITGANATVASGKKAFKYVVSVTPAGTLSGANASVGTGDVYGFSLSVALFPYVDIFWNNALITSPTGFVVPDATSPATATTGDVRGTYAVQSASDGSKRLTVYYAPNLAAISAGSTGLVGVTQA